MTVATATLLVAVPVAPVSAQTDTASEVQRLTSEREQLRSQRAAKAAQLDALQADNAEVSAALSALNANVASQQELLLEAQRGVQEAQRQERLATRAAERADRRAVSIRRSLAARAARAFVTVPAVKLSGVSTGDPNALITRRTYLNLIAGNDQTQVEALRATEADLRTARAAAEEASGRAQEHRSEVSDRLDQLEAAQIEQRRFQELVADKIARASAEADGLAAQDQALSSKLVSEQLALASQLKAAEEARQERLASLRAASVAGTQQVESATNSAVAAPAAPVEVSGSGNIVSVGGIRVASSISGNLSRLLGAARASGISLGGGVYRDPSDQIAVRRSNCGSSYYSIYQAPASSCSPPTAVPGTSEHEKGLAIDFSIGGSAIGYGSSAYNWLRANAASYGFYNLPGEPWHWSTTGN